MANACSPIAVFDSGLGGLSVLRALLRRLPGERFVYLGDSANAPYGSRPTEEVRRLTLDACGRLIRDWGCKALVVACNTATSAAIDVLRASWQTLPVIGIEPALKPAVDRHPGGRVLVLATETTLREQKFARLMQTYASRCEIVPLPCPGLMEFVERGELDSPALHAYLKALLRPYGEPDAVVLGCTHYPFLRPALQKVLGERPEILDGSDGTAHQTARRLAALDLLREQTACAAPQTDAVTLLTTGEAEPFRVLAEKLLYE